MISQKLCSASFLEYLAKSATWNESIPIAYIVFLTKMQKRQNPKMRFAFLISENTKFLKLCWVLIYCSYRQFVDHKKRQSDFWLCLQFWLLEIDYVLCFRLNHTNPIKPEAKRSINATVDREPIFRVIQETAISGARPQRTIVLKISCLAINSAIGGEYL